jgi:hypothetical protein
VKTTCRRFCLARLGVATHVLQALATSGNAGSRHSSRLLFPCAKIRLLGIRPRRLGQPVSLKQLPGGNSSSFQWRMTRPTGNLLQIQSFERSYHPQPVFYWKLELNAFGLRTLASAGIFRNSCQIWILCSAVRISNFNVIVLLCKHWVQVLWTYIIKSELFHRLI